MKSQLPLLSILMLVLFMLSSSTISSTSALEYQKGTTFSYDIQTRLKGLSSSYSGYTERELDTRDYTIDSVVDDVVTISMKEDYSYKDSDGGSLSTNRDYNFKVSASNRSYLDKEDGDPTYYDFDYIWFRVDTQRDTNQILGYTYTRVGEHWQELPNRQVLKVMEYKTENQLKTINTNDYDPDGSFTIVFTEHMYVDPQTGYLLYYTWDATATTSVGQFQWTEYGQITSSSFPLQHDKTQEIKLQIQRFQLLIAIIIIVLVLNIISIFFGRRDVKYAINLIGADISPKLPAVKWYHFIHPMIGLRFAYELIYDFLSFFSFKFFAPSYPDVWNPLELDYHKLLKNGIMSGVSLSPGIFFVIDKDSKMRLVDLDGDRYLDAMIIPPTGNDLEDETDNLIAIFHLALGNFPKTKSIRATAPITGYLAAPTGVMRRFDPVVMGQISGPGRPSKQLIDIAELLAMRKVLDYSHGQAPLSPRSHKRKMEHVLQHSPKKVLLVGDDDLVSISLARRGVNPVVLEIDPYTCALIQGISDKEGLNIEVHQVDLRDPIPRSVPNDFDLFVADPDFTIAAFALFLSRGLSQLRPGGIGLINFEKDTRQLMMVDTLLRALRIDVMEKITEPWEYVIVKNLKRVIGYSGYGKYRTVNYANDLVLGVAGYKSIMYTIQKNDDSIVLISGNQSFDGSPDEIYDY